MNDSLKISEHREIINQKKGLHLLYEETYRKFADCLSRCPEEGLSLEIGSGGGFIHEIIPHIITTDVFPHHGIQLALDATSLPFRDQSLKLICMMNVFHHIGNVELFLREAQRCLLPGGRLYIMDQHPGYISSPIYRYLHSEPFDTHSQKWSSAAPTPLAGANGALAWLVFVRDLDKLKTMFPTLRLAGYRPHTPLRYWFAGGLRKWCFLPGRVFGLATLIDRALTRMCPDLGSFVDIELVKTTEGPPA